MTEFVDDDEIDLFDPETGFMDFDFVMKLYKENPELLERLQKREVHKIIENAPLKNQGKLNGLQFKVDSLRRMSKNPMQSYLKISELFWTEGFQNLHDVLNGDFKLPSSHDSSDNVVRLFGDTSR